MSLNKSAAHRLRLLAGSSLVAAGLMMLAAPTAALAANECGDPEANTTAADSFVCSGVIPSITYGPTNGNLTLRLEDGLSVNGGISVTPTGANTVTITGIAGAAPGMSVNSGTGAAIRVERAAAGAITIGGVNANALRLDTTGTTAGIYTRNLGTGATTVNLSTSRVTATAGAGLDLGTSGTGAISITVGTGGYLAGSTAAVSVSSGAAVTLTLGNNQAPTGEMEGRVLLNNTGNTTFTNNGRWNFDGVSTLRSAVPVTGSATLTNDGVIVTTSLASTIDFGSATGTFSQKGYLAAGRLPGASTLTLAGVDTWNNSGQVFFGMDEMLQTDGEANDRIVVTNSTAASFVSSGASLLVMDVDFGASQANCAAAVTADCLDLRGHNTSGTGAILVNTVGVGFGAERIVLVDAAGAGTDAGTFRVSDQSPGYRPFGDGMVDAGLFLYEITHDTTAKQHVLTIAAVDKEAVELNLAGRAALTSWETTTGTWFDRQADLRTSLLGRDGGGIAPGGWLRITGTYAQQDMVRSLAVGGDSIDVVTSHTQDTTALMGGVDLVGFVDGSSAWVAGVTFGQVNSDLGFTESPNGLEFDGHSLGAYASYVSDTLFVDAIVNTTKLDATYNGASLGMNLEGEAKSIGYRIEGGWRFDWGEGIHFEPLAALSYVTTDLEDMPVAPGVAAQFDSMTSLRGALGARLSGDVAFDSFTVQLAGTGRVWKEFDGEAASRISTGFGDFDFLDVPEDTTGEVGVSLGLFGMGGRLSAQLGSGVKFRSQYQSVDVSLGARYQW